MKTADIPVFKAIADPTRRKIIDLLAESHLSVKQLTPFFGISQPAISQHLRSLRSSKLVLSERVGLEQRYRLTAGPLQEVFGWVEKYRTLFDPAGHAWAITSSQKRTAIKGLHKDTDTHGR